MTTRQIIDYAFDDNAKEMRDALYAEIHDRVTAQIQNKKIEIAQNLFPEEEPQIEQEPQEELE
jgi:hypothetical protein